MDTFQLSLLIYERDDAMRDKLRQSLTYFAVRQNVDLRIDWMFKPDQEKQIPALVPDTLVALVSTDMGERAAIAGQKIYACNPDCLLVYYGTQEVDLSTLLPARPVAFQPQPEHVGAWEELLLRLCRTICGQNRYFHWTRRDQQFSIPFRMISHIQSERSYLTLYTASGDSCKFIGKLDEVEKQFPGVLFLRIHKSALVNLSFAKALDKTRRCLILQNGTELYISRARYRQALESFDAFCLK